MIELTWHGGEHKFDLRIEHLRALQQKCDAGPAWILSRLSTGQWMVDDIIQTIRLGLEGGGLNKEEARKLVKQFVEDEPLSISVLTAQAILVSCIMGVEEDPVGESEAGVTDPQDQNSQEENSTGQASTEPGP